MSVSIKPNKEAEFSDTFNLSNFLKNKKVARCISIMPKISERLQCDLILYYTSENQHKRNIINVGRTSNEFAP